MGIKDLLRFMKPFINPVHIRKYQGKRVGIDAYSWLHKGAYACSMEICMNQSWADAGAPFIQYFMHRIGLLRHHHIVPVVVFDGGCIPCKSATELQRQRRKDENLSLAKEKLSQGDVPAAIVFFQRAISITPVIAYQLIQILRTEQVEFVVAPYEADAQLAYLSKLEEDEGGISAVITEDSDLLAYGCRAVIFKMNHYGQGEEILMDGVFKSCIEGLSFRNFSQELFTGMCVFAGCDFLPSVSGIGIKRAHSLVSKYKNLDRVLSVLKFQKGEQVPEGYVKAFKEAIAVFQHATIYDSHGKVLRPMNQVPQELLELLDGNVEFLGPMINASIAIGIADGYIDPLTFEAFHRHEPNIHKEKQLSCFSIFSSKGMRTNAGHKALMKHHRPSDEGHHMHGTYIGGSFISEAGSLEQASDVNFATNCSQIMEQKVTSVIHEGNHKNDNVDRESSLRKAAALRRLAAVNSTTIFSEMMEQNVVSRPDNNPFSNKQKKKKLSDDGSGKNSLRGKRSTIQKLEEKIVAFTDENPFINKERVGDDDPVESSTGWRQSTIKNMEEETIAFPDSNNPLSTKRKNKRTSYHGRCENSMVCAKNIVNEMEQKTVAFLDNSPFSNTKKKKIGDDGSSDDPIKSERSSINKMEERIVAFPDNNPFSIKKKREKIGDGCIDENYMGCEESLSNKKTANAMGSDPLLCITDDDGGVGGDFERIICGLSTFGSQAGVESAAASCRGDGRANSSGKGKVSSVRDSVGIFRFFTRM